MRHTHQRRLAEAARETQQLRHRLDRLESPRLQLATVAAGDQPAAGTPTVKIYIDPQNRRWFVLAYHFPDIPPDQDYQLWFIPKTGAPIPADLLEQRGDGVYEADVAVPPGVQAEQAAVSLEKKGGGGTSIASSSASSTSSPATPTSP
jgi:hypothetical protein